MDGAVASDALFWKQREAGGLLPHGLLLRCLSSSEGRGAHVLLAKFIAGLSGPSPIPWPLCSAGAWQADNGGRGQEGDSGREGRNVLSSPEPVVFCSRQRSWSWSESCLRVRSKGLQQEARKLAGAWFVNLQVQYAKYSKWCEMTQARC